MRNRDIVKDLRGLGYGLIKDSVVVDTKEEVTFDFIISKYEYKYLHPIIDLDRFKGICSEVLIKKQLRDSSGASMETLSLEDTLYLMAVNGYIPYIDNDVYFKSYGRYSKLRRREALLNVTNNIYRWVLDSTRTTGDVIRDNLVIKGAYYDFIRMYNVLNSESGIGLSREYLLLDKLWDKVKENSEGMKLFGGYDIQLLDFMQQPTILTYQKVVENISSESLFREMDIIAKMSIKDYLEIKAETYRNIEVGDTKFIKGAIDKKLYKENVFIANIDMDVLNRVHYLLSDKGWDSYSDSRVI